MTKQITCALCALGVLASAWSSTAQAAGPDVFVFELAQGGTDINEYGPVGNIMAYAFATQSCNQGTETLNWFSGSAFHPVIAQNMYRLKDDRFEQIGMAWLKHGFCALSEPGCGACQATDCNTLGVGCADTYWAGLNASGLKPRSKVNASTGVFPYPEAQNPTGSSTIAGRVQVQMADIDPAQNAGARYIIEGHYITQDDSSANPDPGNGMTSANNASWREIAVNTVSNLTSIGSTQVQQAAILAWEDMDPTVQKTKATVADDGRFWMLWKVSDNGDGTWHYEYAVFNLDSHRSGQSFSIPIPQGVTLTNIGFHDVDYHGGEPYTNIDWAVDRDSCRVTWSTEDFATNENANALRWSTLYNFRFDADGPPTGATSSLGLFRPGNPTAASMVTEGPSALCNAGDADCDGDFDLGDYATLQSCWVAGQIADPCTTFDSNCSSSLDLVDYSVFMAGLDGP